MKGILNHHFGIYRVFILGAGFSCRAGLPLTSDLLPLIHRQASQTPYGKELWGQAERLLKELEYYYPNIKFTHEKIQNEEFNEKINIEEFLSFASAESSFLHHGERLTEHGSYFIFFCKKWLGEIIVQRQDDLINKIPKFYHDFIKGLQDSLVLTFNWDTIVETLFDYYKIPYRYQLNSEDYQSRNKSIPLIKMHGSIDWVSIPFNNNENLDYISLGNEFQYIVKAKGNLIDFYKKMNYPWIVLPNFDKITQLGKYGKIWESPTRYLNDKLEVIIIGYSMRQDDFHSRSFIYPKLVQESRQGNISVKVVDKANTEEEKKAIKEKYICVENCKFWFDGFSSESLNFIFD